MNTKTRKTTAVLAVVVVVLTAFGSLSATAEPATLSVKAPDNTAPGSQFTITYTLENTGDADDGYILDVGSLPDGWTIVGHADDGGTWKASESKWLWQTISPGQTVRPSVTVAVPADAEATSYTVSATALDKDGTVASATDTVTVRESVFPRTSVTDRPTATKTATKTATPTSTPVGPQVGVSYGGNNRATISVQNAGEDSMLQTQFRFRAGDACVNLQQLQFRTRATQNFEFRVRQMAEAPSGTPAWQARSGEPAFGYVRVTHGGELGDGQFRFQVRTDCLADRDLDRDRDRDRLRLYRYDDGNATWDRLQTHLREQNQTHVTYVANTSEFSVFAVGYAEANISVTEATLDATQITAGEMATLTATLTNDGEVAGNYTLEMASDGTVLQSTNVTLAAGETREVSLFHQFDAPGEYVITAGDVTAGTLTVEAAATATPTQTATATPTETTTDQPTTATPTETTTETPAEDPGDDGLSTTQLALLLLALAGIVVAAYLLVVRGGGGE